jgi:hypothetical protein
VKRHSPDAATHVQAQHPWTQTDPVQQGCCGGPFYRSEQAEPLGSLIAAPKHIVIWAWEFHGFAFLNASVCFAPDNAVVPLTMKNGTPPRETHFNRLFYAPQKAYSFPSR